MQFIKHHGKVFSCSSRVEEYIKILSRYTWTNHAMYSLNTTVINRWKVDGALQVSLLHHQAHECADDCRESCFGDVFWPHAHLFICFGHVQFGPVWGHCGELCPGLEMGIHPFQYCCFAGKDQRLFTACHSSWECRALVQLGILLWEPTSLHWCSDWSFWLALPYVSVSGHLGSQ